MKKIQLGGHMKNGSIKGYAIVDDADFQLLQKFKWSMDKDGYAIRQYGTHTKVSRILMSREIMKPGVGMDVDHIDRDRLNNRRENLRVCTRSQNNMNARVRANSASGFKGVYFDKRKKKFESYIGINKKHKHLGYFETPREAAIVYNEAASLFFGKFARLNKII
jgi:hypothetical protein